MAQNVVVPPFDVAPETVVGSTPQSVFAFDFPFWSANDLMIYVDDVLLETDAYTVEGLSVQNGDPVEGGYGSGVVTLNAPVSNCSVTIDRFVVGERLSQFSRAAPLGMPALNSDINKLTARQQDLGRRVGRALLAPIGADVPSAQDVIDAAAAIAGRATINGSNVLPADFRDSLELGDAATKSIGTTTGSVAAGDDPRITGAAPQTALDSLQALAPGAKASIRHVRGGDFVYDLIELRGTSQALRKVKAPVTASDGVATRITINDMVKSQVRYPVLINCDGWRGVETGTPEVDPTARPAGLNIIDGVLYQGWVTGETRYQAMVMQKNGMFALAQHPDVVPGSKTGAQWVEEGVRFSICWGAACVVGGVALDSSAIAAYIAPTAVSARSVIGQKADGTILIAMIEGKTDTYGATPVQCGTLMASLGCQLAYVFDGGGSSQCWWEDCYAAPSSDSSSRALPNFLAIDVPSVPIYDTGNVAVTPNASFVTGAQNGNYPSLFVRQRGAEVRFTVNAQGVYTRDALNTLTDGGIPIRFRPSGTFVRGFVPGPSGALIAIYGGGTDAATTITARADSAATSSNPSYAQGAITWPSRWTG